MRVAMNGTQIEVQMKENEDKEVYCSNLKFMCTKGFFLKIQKWRPAW